MKDTLGPDADSPLGDSSNSIKAYWYHDVQARFAVDGDRLEFYAGIDNVFDKKPPVINRMDVQHHRDRNRRGQL